MILVATAAALGGCRRAGSEGDTGGGASDGGASLTLNPQGKVLEAAENEAATAGSAVRRAPAAPGQERIDVPGGKLTAGSMPGDKGRDPTLEPALLEVELGGFSMDRFLYPNDPGKPPLTGVTRAKATELCQQAGGRLCTELEWERACKGSEGSPYATGAAWDPACEKEPASCASGFGVLGMGAMREWTASDVGEIEDLQARAGAVRGAARGAPAQDRRCAHRSAVDPKASGDDLGFRCCRGAPNAATIPSPGWQQTYRKATITPAQVAEMIASVPHLQDIAGVEISFFKEPDDVNAALARSDGGAPANTTLTTSPLLWSPVPGEEILVVAGKADKHAFVLAFYRLPGDRYRIASSLVLKEEKGPVVLGFNGYIRKRLPWATCVECRGESGHVTYRDDHRVVIIQK
ncbi:formylglycine-generating enzyme family protein [Chondromyces apiculatus]|uniref:Protein kinase domain protein n=1 Tax=Chondromyces apiculatus DSM 436 TaxID=1192034 RepID=A0A017T436_9BACT|nr:SUMF1/EgtB/PvdO family nonheme iron enzyme [Chondromyces apiculatus]EYF04009.1 protein kinase domain protein [Chondromyces apiculatus DSM 436]